MSAIVVDLGPSTSAAIVVSELGSWLVPDPHNANRRWPTAIAWDGSRMVAGGLAEQRRVTEPAGYVEGFTRRLDADEPILLGPRTLRPVEQLTEFLALVRAQAERQHGAIDRAVVTIPASYLPGDPRRGSLLAAAESAGLGAVELLAAPSAAVHAPVAGPPLRPGDLVLTYDLGEDFQATLVLLGDDRDEIVAHGRMDESVPMDRGGSAGSALLERTVQCCRDVLARAGVAATALAGVLTVGDGSRVAGLETTLVRSLGAGVRVREPEDPELAVVCGAAEWLRHSGARLLSATRTAGRIVPLSFPVPGAGAKLVRWLVAADEAFEPGQSLARVRLAGGAIWDLTAGNAGTLDQILVTDGAPVSGGDWLALARQ